MKRLPPAPRQVGLIGRPNAMTTQYLEEDDELDYSDDEELTATERARSSLQRRGLAAEEEV